MGCPQRVPHRAGGVGISRKITGVTPDQAAEIAVQGTFAKADGDAAERLRREGKPEATTRAD